MRSWRPRRPSARLKARVFGQSVAIDRQRRLAFGWLAPATVCLLLFLVTFSQRNAELTRLASASNQVPMMALTLTVSGATDDGNPDRNAVRPDTFEWTNHGHSPSSIPAFPQARTNYLKR